MSLLKKECVEEKKLKSISRVSYKPVYMSTNYSKEPGWKQERWIEHSWLILKNNFVVHKNASEVDLYLWYTNQSFEVVYSN